MKLFRCRIADTTTGLRGLSTGIKETVSQLAARRELNLFFLFLFSFLLSLHKPGLVLQFSSLHAPRTAARKIGREEVQAQEGEGKDPSFGSITSSYCEV